MSGRLKNSVFPLVAGAVLIVTSIIGGATVSAQDAQLEAQQSKLDKLTSAAEAARAATDDLETAASLADAGANPERVAADSDAIGELVRRTLTWDSDASYREARESTMRAYALGEDSALMKSFLPPAPVNLDGQGNEYPYIAAGLNSQVGDYRAKLLSVDGVNYVYMVLVDVQVKSGDGLGTAVNVATLFLTIDGEGTFSDLRGFASTTATRTSG